MLQCMITFQCNRSLAFYIVFNYRIVIWDIHSCTLNQWDSTRDIVIVAGSASNISPLTVNLACLYMFGEVNMSSMREQYHKPNPLVYYTH